MPAFTPALDDQDPFSRRLMDGIEASVVPLTEEEIRRARRAYLANVSYLDSKSKGGRWLVRIDDIDPPRQSDAATRAILASLDAHHLVADR